MAQNELWKIAKKKMVEDRGASPREDGALLLEHQAMHEDNFLSCWLREDVEGKEERESLNEEAKQEESKRGNSEEESIETGSEKDLHG